MKKTIISILLALAGISAYAAASLEQIIPAPKEAVATGGTVSFAACKVKYCGVSADVKTIAGEFAEKLAAISGSAAEKTPLTLKKDVSCPSEGYTVTVTADGVTVCAADYNGFLYGLETLRQLLPASIYGTDPTPDADWTLPCCTIKDSPFFSYRGAHLDVARHFFSVDEVKKYLDAMAVCKMNRFHWHLTEDQGWRIQIDKYPLLTKIGAWRKGTQMGFDRNSCDGVRYGGYYTKDQIREVVAYAKKLGIEIIPEIDLPGHMMGALASYPNLGCTGGPYEVWTKWGISKQVLCPGKEETFKFLEDVLSEVTELFPYEIFHIGGDECPKDSWKTCPDCQKRIAELGYTDTENGTKEDYLQSYVMTRMMNFLATKGKRVIGWDEILKGDPAKGTTIMHWRGGRDCTEAARRGFDVVLVPSTYLYFDYVQLEDYTKCPPSISSSHGKPGPNRIIPFSKTYSFEPFKGLNPEQSKHVVGVQCNLWTEYIATPEHLEYMAMPRMFATSELQWADPATPKNLERVKTAVTGHEFKVLDAMGFIYCTELN